MEDTYLGIALQYLSVAFLSIAVLFHEKLCGYTNVPSVWASSLKVAMFSLKCVCGPENLVVISFP